MKYAITGVISLGRKETKFLREIDADSEEYAREKLLSDIGGKYRINRRKIKIVSIVKKSEKEDKNG